MVQGGSPYNNAGVLVKPRHRKEPDQTLASGQAIWPEWLLGHNKPLLTSMAPEFKKTLRKGLEFS
jgi:hypothetical protein